MAGLIEVGILKPDLGNALAAGYQGAERARMQNQQAQLQSQQAQQELETGKLNLEQLKQDRVLMLQLQQQLRDAGRDPDLNKVFDALIATGKPDYVMKGVDGKRRLKAQQDFDSVIRGMMPGAAEQPSAPTNALAPSQPAMPAAQPPANALVRPPAASAAPAAPAVPVNALVPTPQQPVNALGGSQRVAELQRQIMALSASSDPRAKPMIEMLQAQLRQETTPQRATVPGVGLVNARTGEVITPERPAPKLLTPEEEAQQMRLRPPRQTVVKVGGEAKPAEPVPELSLKDRQKREANYPAATQAIKGIESQADLFVKQLESLRDDIGLAGITGPIYGRTPSITADSSRAQAKYDQIVAKGGFALLQQMRDASKTGGALGNISNKEGEQLKAAFARIDRRQSKEDVEKAINEAIDTVRNSASLAREAYDTTYSYRNPEAAPKAPPPTAVPAAPVSATSFSDADKERRYQEWKAKQGQK